MPGTYKLYDDLTSDGAVHAYQAHGFIHQLQANSLSLVHQLNKEQRNMAVLAQLEHAYDTLILCLGSVSNDFGVPGASQHPISLDTLHDAERFHRRLLATCVRADGRAATGGKREVDIVIIGAGATGVTGAAGRPERVDGARDRDVLAAEDGVAVHEHRRARHAVGERHRRRVVADFGSLCWLGAAQSGR